MCHSGRLINSYNDDDVTNFSSSSAHVYIGTHHHNYGGAEGNLMLLGTEIKSLNLTLYVLNSRVNERGIWRTKK